jgi:hypothetical protein
MHNYYIHYVWSVPNFKGAIDMGKLKEECVFASDPIAALNEFHRTMQRKRVTSVSDKKHVLRPKLQPDQYRITKMTLRYNGNFASAYEDTVDQVIDLPKTSNPDLWPKTYVSNETPTQFGFFSDCAGKGSLSA